MNDQQFFSRISTVILSTIVVIGAFIFFVIRPTLQRNADAMNAAQAILVDQDIAKNQQQQLKSIRSQVEHIRSLSGQLTVTVSPNDPIRWVQDFEQLAKDTGNTITIETNDAYSSGVTIGDKKSPIPAKVVSKTKDAKPTLQDERGTLPGLGLRLTLDGDYASLTLFLKKLELLPYFVDVFSLAFSKNDPGTGKSAVDSGGVPVPGSIRNPFQSPVNTQMTSTTQALPGSPTEIRPLRAVLNVVLAISQ